MHESVRVWRSCNVIFKFTSRNVRRVNADVELLHVLRVMSSHHLENLVEQLLMQVMRRTVMRKRRRVRTRKKRKKMEVVRSHPFRVHTKLRMGMKVRLEMMLRVLCLRGVHRSVVVRSGVVESDREF